MTLNQIAYDLALIVRGGKLSDDENINLRQIKFWVNNVRSRLIAQDIEKKKDVSDNIIQSLGCVEVSLVDAAACCSIKVDCDVLRTDVKIPNVINPSHRQLLTRVGPADLTSPAYTLIPYGRAAFSGKGKYTKLQNFAFVHDNYVYVMGPQAALFQRINIQGVFEDPTEISTFKTCSGDSCYTDDSEYPISRRQVEQLKEMVLQTNFRIAATAPTDTSGDAKANVEPSVKQ